jgi:hypothetical protein
MNLKHIGKNLIYEISKNSPVILTSVAVSGVLATAIFSAKGHLKAVEIIEKNTGYNHDGIMEVPSKSEAAKLTWKCYVPAGVCAGVTIGTIIVLNRVHTRRTASLAAVYSITETAFKEYQNKVAETSGKNKEQVIRDDINHDHVQRNPKSVNEIFITGKGEHTCYDSLSGRYFKSDIEKIRQLINTLNYRMRSEMYIGLNDFYDEIGLGPTRLGEDLGWNMDNGEIRVTFSTQLADDGTPCLVLNYEVVPKFSYEVL